MQQLYGKPELEVTFFSLIYPDLYPLTFRILPVQSLGGGGMSVGRRNTVIETWSVSFHDVDDHIYIAPQGNLNFPNDL